MYILRDYQKKAVQAGLETFASGKNSIAVLPTGAGKSLVIADLAQKLAGYTIVFQPNKEILEQNLSKLLSFAPELPVGVFSASKGSKTLGKVTFATIGTIYRQKHLWDIFDNVIIDEAHAVNAESGMYKEFLSKHKGAVFGLTATPYRLHQYTDAYGENYVVAKFLHRTRSRVFSRLSHITQIGDMYDMGYLAPVEYVTNDGYSHDEIKLNSTGRDFDDNSLRAYNEQVGVVKMVADEIMKQTAKHILVFNKFVQEAEELSEELERRGITTATISADTKKRERESVLAKFKSGEIRVVTNVGVLTTGFDFPELDCVILARPTQSVALYYQMVGRGVRIAEGKDKARVIDVCGNVKRFGKIESFEIIEPKPNLHRLKSSSGFLTGFDFVHNIDVETIGYKGLSKQFAQKRRDELRKMKQKSVKEAISNKIITFGKHKGESVTEVPMNYIDWVIDNFDDGDIKNMFIEEKNRRNLW